MYEYFPGNYWWSLMVCNSLGMGGEMSEIDRFIGPLREVSGNYALMGPGDEARRAAWTAAWRQLGDHIEKLAAEEARRGFRAGAARRYFRAANYGFVTEAVTSNAHPDKPEIYATAQRRFREAIKLSQLPIEFLEVPFENTALPALFVRAVNIDGPAPCMIHFDGSHDVKEVTYMRHRQGLAERGISMLIVDHPGSGEALRLKKLYARVDIEKAATACVDYLEGRSDVDPDAIGIIAQSMGGYYAPRSAAFEKRLKVCVVWGALWDFHQVATAVGLRPDPVEFSLFGLESTESILERMKEYTLEGGIMEQIECPVMVLHGENDRQVPLWTAERTYERATSAAQRELRVFTRDEGGDEHCQVNIMSIATDYIHDWLAVFFGRETAEA